MTADGPGAERIRRHQWLASRGLGGAHPARGHRAGAGRLRRGGRGRRPADGPPLADRAADLPVREAVRAVPPRRRLPRPRRPVPGPGRRLAAAADGGGRDGPRDRRGSGRRDQRRLPPRALRRADHAHRRRDPGLPPAGLRPAAAEHPGPQAVADRAGRRADPRARRRPGAAVRDPGHLRAGFRQGGRAAGDAPGRGDDQGDPAQPEHAADGGGGTAADLLDHHHGGPGLPGLRPAAARRPAGGP